MSVAVRSPPAEKKMSSWVRPGVCEVRASAWRPVSALIRLDLPTLDRPAKAISTPRIAGRLSSDEAAVANCQSPANSFRPASISSGEGPAVMAAKDGGYIQPPRHARPCAAHPRPRAMCGLTRGADSPGASLVAGTDVDGRDKPGHDGE